MTPTELRAILAALGWSQLRAAQELDVAPRLMRYWCAGRYPIPRVAAVALRALQEAKR